MTRKLLVVPIVLLLITWLVTTFFFGVDRRALRLSGQTMGTSYNIIVIGTDLDRDALAAIVKERLAAVNASLSNWDPNSEVAKFSASDQTGPVKISDGFAAVMAAAAQVHGQSAGRFDVTLGPLIELWGFGPRRPGDSMPSEAAITAALAHVGQANLLSLDSTNGTLAKSHGEVGVNLSAIAKGYGVDALAGTLRAAGVENYMVEIGGDLVTRGRNQQGELWRIGIEQPRPDTKVLQLVVPVTDRALATSGDYRNFFEADGVRYSHIFDPTTGRPIVHRTTSVTVVAESAMMADAWATAMLVLGQEAGLEVAKAQNLAVFFVSRDASGTDDAYITAQSGAFADLFSAE